MRGLAHLAIFVLASACAQAQTGPVTVAVEDRHALSRPVPAMPVLTRLEFSVGQSFFRNPWVTAPSSTTARDGLGPLYNAGTCRTCHIGNGRGQAPEAGKKLRTVLVRASRRPPSATGLSEQESHTLKTSGALPATHYGRQIQNFAVPGLEPEAQVFFSYTPVIKTFADGSRVTLRRPEIKVVLDAERRMSGAKQNFSARLAPPLTGLGLLEAIPEADILAWADPGDSNGDGISGRPNRVFDRQTGESVLGRFGWKAGQPSVLQQVAAAFSEDLGITSSLFPRPNCADWQTDCLKAPHGGDPEISDNLLAKVALFSANLAVPASRDRQNPQVMRGKKLFTESGCAQCHRPAFTTGESTAWPWLSHQSIEPYTDLLLHDMGPALADEHAEFSAEGREWRTPPLWGIGLGVRVAERPGFLHDGRARTLLEAVLWHGGEAQSSVDKVLAFSKSEREALLAFLNSL